jgi:ligand-binding SRPBCC domain-containing protein
MIEVQTVVSCSAERLFDLALDMDAHSASLGPSGETATTSTGRAGLRLGDEVTFHARHLGRTWRMTSRVSHYDRPRRFVDEQVRGPFREMSHEHLFEEVEVGVVRMTDRMTFVAPAGILGACVARLVLALYLRRLLVARAAHLKASAEPPAG